MNKFDYSSEWKNDDIKKIDVCLETKKQYNKEEYKKINEDLILTINKYKDKHLYTIIEQINELLNDIEKEKLEINLFSDEGLEKILYNNNEKSIFYSLQFQDSLLIEFKYDSNKVECNWKNSEIKLDDRKSISFNLSFVEMLFNSFVRYIRLENKDLYEKSLELKI